MSSKEILVSGVKSAYHIELLIINFL